MNSLAGRIKSKLDEKGLSAYKLEKHIGLKRSAVNNILYGKSKSPGIETIQAIAKGLDCSIVELLEGDSWLTQQNLSLEDIETLKLLTSPLANKDLYFQVLQVVGALLYKQSVSLSRKQIFHCIEEIYNYSLKSEKKEVDRHFAEWIIDKLPALD